MKRVEYLRIGALVALIGVGAVVQNGEPQQADVWRGPDGVRVQQIRMLSAPFFGARHEGGHELVPLLVAGPVQHDLHGRQDFAFGSFHQHPGGQYRGNIIWIEL